MIISLGLMFTLLNSTMTVFQRQDKIADLEKQKKVVQKEKKSLEKEINLLSDDDYVARYARENHVFTRDGEEVSIIPSMDK